ncbi:hypothetical protein DM806_22160 [Sphingobium lactosutens]|uniref:hypothetical protein n=1 Tax=Sphingobium lactosutens TaxID=522773 RepID=UPI0015BDE268|nr:hypothetical protein [Sphingobium lactosutens]NWK98321.1 hypothetical protein [Sphingobium lactosutens]
MRPTPEEIIASARTLMKDHVAPELSSEAQAHFRRVMSALRNGRWNETAFDLLHENEALAALIHACLDQHGRSLPESLIGQLRSASERQAAGTPRSFAEANAVNHALRKALTGLIEAMRDGQVPDDAALGSLIVAVSLGLQDRPQPDDVQKER